MTLCALKLFEWCLDLCVFKCLLCVYVCVFESVCVQLVWKGTKCVGAAVDGPCKNGMYYVFANFSPPVSRLALLLLLAPRSRLHVIIRL